MAESLVSWCRAQLKSNFGLDVSEDIVQYIVSFENEEDIEEYIHDLIQGMEGKKRKFTEELISRWQKTSSPHDPVLLYAKKDEAADKQLLPGDASKRGRRKGRNKQETPLYIEADSVVEEVKTPIDLAKAQESSSGGSSSKKKAKFVNLYTKEGQDKLAVLIPGRHPCECLAQKHRLINNCLACGRIVCEQEGSGPCLFCGTLVCTKEEQDILQRDSNKSQKLLKKLLTGNEIPGKTDGLGKDLLPHHEARIRAGLEKAQQHKDKLLDFDKTSARRTQVIDDESDYFATDSNQWLSKQEREALRKKEKELQDIRHASRLSRKITFDFAGRQIVDEQDNLADYHRKLEETVKAIDSGILGKSPRTTDMKGEQERELVNPNIFQPAPVWVEQTSSGLSQKKDISSAVVDASNQERVRLRLQDRELQELADDGMCLSMHQPWASLLVAGIKRVEGRTWYSSHRGRLWIAAAAKRPSPQEISELESSYRMLHRKSIEFPKDYPTACLLGCVDVLDCLSQEQFAEQFPDLSQECGSPFVFVCTNPKELLVKFPMKGKHKIWKLDSKIHQGAKKGLKT
ncbi:activating signal cointegrator 1 [Lissotriton helveticus]